MQSVSAGFTAQAAAMVHIDAAKFEVRWNGSDWVDESEHLLSHEGECKLTETGTGELSPLGTTDRLTVLLKNYQFRFSPLHVGGDDDLRTYFDGAAGMHGIHARLSQGFATTNTQITAFADAGGGLLRVTSAGHGLVVSDAVRLQGTGIYNGRYTVAAKTTDTFDVSATYSTNTARGQAQKLEFVRVFTGVIYGHQEDGQQKTVSLDIRDMGFLYLQERASTALYEFQRADEWISTLATLAGIAAPTVDTGPHRAPYCWLDDESILEDMQVMAAAAGGRLYFDHSGTLHYEEPTHWLLAPHATSQWTFTAADGFLTPDYDSAELATEIVVETAPRAPIEAGVLYSLERAITIPPASSVVFDVRFQAPAITVDDLQETDFYLCTAGGHPMRQYCTVSVTEYAQRATVTIANAHTTMAADLVMFQLRGTPLGGAPSEEVVQDVTTPAVSHTRTRSLRENQYVQSAPMARGLASYLADRYEKVIPVWALQLKPGASLPHLELGDRVTFSDGLTVSTARDGFITGIRWRFDGAGYNQTLTILDGEDLYSGGPYFVIGSTALGSGEAWH